MKQLNVRRCKRLRVAKENLNTYAKTMAKWMLEWTELINNIDDKIAASGQD